MFSRRKLLFSLVIVALSAMALADLTPVDLLNAGHADEAIRTLSKQVATGGSAQSFNLLARAYYSVEDYENAIRNGERSVQLDPNTSNYHLWLGRAYGERASQANMVTAFSLARKTVASFEKAVQLDPKDWRARKDLAEYYTEAPAIVGGGRDKALKLADNTAAQDAATAAWIRGIVAQKDKNFGEAEKQFKYGITASGNNAGAWVELARFYRNQQRWQDFDHAVSEALATSNRTSENTYDTGEVMVKAGRNLPLAIDTLRKYVESGRTDEYGAAFRAHYFIGIAYEKLGNRGEAQKSFKSALSLASGFHPAQEALRRVGG